MNDEQPKQSRSLQQMYEDSMAKAASAGGQECPNCSCRDFRVVNTWKTGEGTKRARICRHCGTRLTTCEVIIPKGYGVRIEKKSD